MKRAIFRQAEPGDIAYIAANLRQADRDELRAACGDLPVRDILADALARSTLCWTATTEDGVPLCLFGVAPISLMSDTGSPWLLGTDPVYYRAIAREGRDYVQQMLAVYPHLLNFVDARNTRSVRWLARIGFQIHPAVPYGAAGLPFHPFEMRRAA